MKTRSIDPGAMSSGEDDLDELSDEKWDKSPEKKSEKYDDDSSAFWPELPASLAALESAYEAARDDAFRLESTVETLRGRVRDAERRARVAPAPRTRGALLGSSRGDSSTRSPAPLFSSPCLPTGASRDSPWRTRCFARGGRAPPRGRAT